MTSGSERRAVMLLPEETVRRIAAGEVITRPAAAVKELVENALDAGARTIRVEVKEGGRNLIKVTDDGCGMTREDLRLAVARHATSKLRTVEDLQRISSFGFRGEALASIAAVTRLTVETNTDPDYPGTQLDVEGGSVIELREVGRARGTTVKARALFYNLPVRRAFLKSDSYELRLVVETIRSYALAYPQTTFDLVADGRPVMRLPSAASVRERLQALYEKRLVEGLVEVRVDNPLLSLNGWFCAPSQVRSFYEIQNVYFNGRPVRSRVVTRAVYEGYGPMLAGNNPDFVLFITTDPARLDVNLHPTKQEVKFADERFLFDFVSEAVRQGLGIQRSEGLSDAAFLFQRGFAAEDAAPSDFWQLHNTYVLAQVSSGYVIVDQHAAHERVLFEEILKGRQAAAPQGLLFPIQLELGAEEYAVFEQVGEKLARMGLEIRPFGGRTVIVETIPAGSYLGRDEVRGLFAELARSGISPAAVELELAKVMACKGAVKAGQRLSPPEMESLINRLFACTEPYFCPHGRPAIIKITAEELARRFGRE